MKRSAVSGSGVSPDNKSARGESNMADSSFYQETFECIQEESETPPTEPNLKDIHNILKSIQGAIAVMQGTIAKLVKENNKLSGDIADLRHIIAKSNSEVENLKRDFTKQNQYVASLELELEREKTTKKRHPRTSREPRRP